MSKGVLVSGYFRGGWVKYVEVVDFVSCCSFSIRKALDECFCCGGVLG